MQLCNDLSSIWVILIDDLLQLIDCDICSIQSLHIYLNFGSSLVPQKISFSLSLIQLIDKFVNDSVSFFWYLVEYLPLLMIA